MRLVADADAKPCNICYKPTCTVLVAATKNDFFYVCPMHLKDQALASPVHPESYKQLLNDKKDLEERIREANAKAEANRPYSWNKFAARLGFSETPGKEDSQDKKTQQESEPKPKDAKTYQDYVGQANTLKKELAELSSSISSFQFKKYSLHSDFYKARLNAKAQAALRAKRLQEIQSGAIFPTAPKSDPGLE